MTTLTPQVELRTEAVASRNSGVTYDLHGVVGIQVVDGKRSDIRSLEGQLGLERTRLCRLPDLTIRYVDRIPLTGRLKYLAGDAAFAGDAFVLTAGRAGPPVALVPFADLGSNCELVIGRGLSVIPLLVPILNLTALWKGYLPVHASAFDFDGVGVLVAGGARGGKTGTLLAFMAQGATFVGDDWVLMREDGGAMYGLPAPMSVKDAYLRALPEFEARLDAVTQRRIRAMRSILSIERWAPNNSSGNSLVARARARARASLAARLTVRVSPRRLFGAATGECEGVPDIVFLARSVDSPRVTVRPVGSDDLASRLVPLLEYEWRELDQRYALFRSAFPEQRNGLVEAKGDFLRNGLATALGGKRTYEVCYPSPAPVNEIFRVLEPLITRHRSRSAARLQSDYR